MLKRFFLSALFTVSMTNSAHADPDPVPSAPVTVTKPAKPKPPEPVDVVDNPAAEGCPPSSYTGRAHPASLAGLALVAAATLFVRRRRKAVETN